MRKILFTAGVLTALACGPVMAADLGVAPLRPPPVAVVPVVALYTWTGCYVGGNGGGLWAHRDWNDPVFGLGDFGSQNVSGGLGGVQAGCNYQRGNWVLGVQGEWDWTSAKHDDANIAFPLVTDHSEIKWLASVTARTGYAWDRFFGYVKGGGAWLKSDLSLQVAGATAATFSENNRSGWTIGVGGEYAFLDWLTGFVEYDYYQFRNDTNSFVCATCGFVVPAGVITTLPVETKTRISVVKAGLNLKFGPNTRWGW
jgi:outer membrane immunogenic protein